MPKRYSRPMTAPLSRLKKSSARLPKSPWPSDRVKRCVTRNELLNRGSRSVVGSVTMVKSGCEKLISRSGSSALTGAAGAGAAAAACAAAWCGQLRTHTASTRISRVVFIVKLLIVTGAKGDPSSDDLNLAGRQERAVATRHADSSDIGSALELVNDIAVVRISRDHAHGTRLVRAADANQVGVRHGGRQIEAGGEA